MVFLTPLFLVGLLAALLPVAIHLIRREKPPKLMFPTIRFMKKTSRKLVLFQQIQQWLLLALRSLLIVLLVLAFARPLINQTVARLLDADPQSAVVLLDVSMSMQFGEVFNQAQEEFVDILAGMNAGDEVAVITFDAGVESVREFDTDIDAVRGFVDALPAAGFGATRYMPALQAADQLLEESRFENRAVYLISDFQANAQSDILGDWKLAPGIAFFPVDVGEPGSENLTLTDVRSPEQLLEAESSQPILARVRSTGSRVSASGEVSLRINGQTVDRQPIDLSERSEQVFEFDTEFSGEGSYSGEIRLSSDPFPLDNSHYLVVDVLPKIRVLLVNGEASANWFEDEGHWFGLAIDSPRQSPFELTRIEPDALTAAALRQHDVVALLNVGPLSNSQAGSLVDYVQQGGSVLFALGDRVQQQGFNQQFAAIAPASLNSAPVFDRNDYLVIAEIDRRHPILQPIDTDWTARFEGRWRLTPADGAQVLMQFDNTEPALVERRVGEGRVLMFASSLDLEWNNLALQGLFLPFVHETLQHLVQSAPLRRRYSVGEMLALADVPGEVETLFSPDGEEVEIGAGQTAVELSRPGLYRLQTAAGSLQLAVNTLPLESDLSRADPAGLYDAIINPESSPIQSREVQTAQLVEELERPQRLWWWILLAAMALIMAESLVANRTYR